MRSLLMAASVFIGANSYASSIVASGNKITKTYSVRGIENVEVNGYFKVNMTKGSASNLKIKGDDNLVPHIKVEANSKKLKVYLNLDYESPIPFEVNFSSSKLREYKANGNVNASINGYDEKEIDISVSGNSLVNLQKTIVDHLSLELVGKNEAILGEVTTLTGDISKGLNSVSIPRKTDVSGLRKSVPSTIIYR